jgi:hypothetical protein
LSSHLFVDGALHEGHRLGVLRVRHALAHLYFAICSRGFRRSAGPFVATLVRSIFEAVRAQFHRVVDQLAERFPEATAMLSDAGPDILAFTTCPQARRKQIWSNNPQSV